MSVIGIPFLFGRRLFSENVVLTTYFFGQRQNIFRDWDEKGVAFPGIVGDVEAELVWVGPRERAELLLASIMPDDPGFFQGEIVDVDGASELRIVVSTDNLSSVRSTMDDILACLSAVEASLSALGEE